MEQYRLQQVSVEPVAHAAEPWRAMHSHHARRGSREHVEHQAHAGIDIGNTSSVCIYARSPFRCD